MVCCLPSLLIVHSEKIFKMIDINVVNFLRIGYHIVTEEINQEKLETYQNLSYETFELVKKLPMNYLQLKNTMRYFLVMKDSFPKIGYFIHRCVEGNIQPDLINDISNDHLINFFFFDENVDFDKLKGYFSPNFLRYPLIQNSFETANVLLKKIDEDESVIRQIIENRFTNFSLNVWEKDAEQSKRYFKDNPFQNIYIAKNNYYILNHMIGNYWTKDINEFQEKDEDSSSLSKLIEQANNIHGIQHAVKYGSEENVKHSLSPLILVIPKNNKYEQNFNYLFKPKINEGDEYKIKIYFNGLDDIVFHQAISTFSPVIRTPIVKIEDSYYSKLNPDIFSNIDDDTKAGSKEIEKIIRNFGDSLAKKILTIELKKYLEQLRLYCYQLVIISDLPVEYMQLEGLPISLTHDVCRINEDEMRKGYDLNKYYACVLNETLIQKTLVIFLDQNNDIISKAFKIMKEVKERIDQTYNSSFNLMACNTIEEIKVAISTYDPTLLIFYCHGGYELGESFLVLNENENLYSKDVIEHEIKAELIVLCACNTSPIVSYKNIIPNAFLQAGALSVVASFNTIDAIYGGIFIQNLLVGIADYKNIKFANWLQFISFNLRSMAMFTIEDMAESDEKMKIIELWDRGYRKEAIELYLKELQKTNPNVKEFWDLDFDWMYFTILGRADLIYFNSYIQRYWRM